MKATKIHLSHFHWYGGCFKFSRKDGDLSPPLQLVYEKQKCTAQKRQVLHIPETDLVLNLLDIDLKSFISSFSFNRINDY